MKRFEGKSGIVTGGGSGMGREVVKLITSQGGKVMILDRDKDVGSNVLGEVEKAGGTAIFELADVTNEEQTRAAIARCRSEFESFDFIHNNAGVQLEKALHETTVSEWDWVNDVNLKGVFIGCKQAVLDMKENGGGSIVNTASVCAHAADPFLPAYNATKHGVLGLTRSVAVGYAEDGIRANCVSPGDMLTPMLQKYFDATDDPEAARHEMAQAYPAKRLGDPREVAQVAVFLLSDDASFVSGESVLADGALFAKAY